MKRNFNCSKNGTYQFNGYLSGRMPGMAPIYVLLRRFLVKIFHRDYSFLANFCHTPFQPFILLKVTYKYGMNKITSFILTLSPNYITHWGTIFHTECLAISFLMIALGILSQIKNKISKKNLLLLGFFLTWLIFLRPYCIIVLVIILFYLLLK